MASRVYSKAIEIAFFLLRTLSATVDRFALSQGGNRMGRQEYFVAETTLRNIIEMLSNTDLPVKQIAQCTSCAANLVVSVNRRFQIRVVTLDRDRRRENRGGILTTD